MARTIQRLVSGHSNLPYWMYLCGGVEKDVIFEEEADPEINRQVDLAYCTKYGCYAVSIVDPMLASPARETNIR